MEKYVTTQQLYEVSYRVAHDYFSDILNNQLIIFSVIVATMVGLQFYWSYRISKNKIAEEVGRQVKKVEHNLFEEYKKRVDALVEIAATSERKLNSKNRALQADIYRTMGHFFDSEKQYGVAFIWWMRAIENYVLVGEEKMTRTSLKWAKESVERISYSVEIESDIGEYQKILALLDDSLYRLEKAALDKEVENTLNKKLSS